MIVKTLIIWTLPNKSLTLEFPLQSFYKNIRIHRYPQYPLPLPPLPPPPPWSLHTYAIIIPPPAVPSGPPTRLMTSSSNPRSITLTWGPPQDDQQNGILRYYLVTLTSTLPTITRNISSTITSITVGGLTPFTSYTCTVSVATVGVGPSTTGQTIVTQEDGMYVCLYACMYVCENASNTTSTCLYTWTCCASHIIVL